MSEWIRVSDKDDISVDPVAPGKFDVDIYVGTNRDGNRYITMDADLLIDALITVGLVERVNQNSLTIEK